MSTPTLNLLIESAPQMLLGAFTTFKLWITASVLGLGAGSIVGSICCNRLRISVISPMLDFITFVLRGIPFYVQLLIVYFVLPELIGLNLSPFAAGTLALGLCSAGYASQTIRAGINSISKGQWEAGYVLGYSTLQTVLYIILPQMLKNVIPALGGELDQLLKSTSMLSAIGFLELTRVGMNIIAREMAPLTIYLSIAVLYLCMSSLLNIIVKKIERKLSYC